MVGEPCELGHQGDTRTSGRGHGACTRPTCADDCTERREFVFCLEDRVCSLPGFFVIAELWEVFVESICEACGGRDGVPRDDLDTTVDRTERAGHVSFCEDLAFVATFDALHLEWIDLCDVLSCPLCGEVDDFHVEVDGFLFAFEVCIERQTDLVEFDVEELTEHTNIHHVGDVVAEACGDLDLLDDLFDRHRVVRDIFALCRHTQAVVVKDHATGFDQRDIFVDCRLVHRDEDVCFVAVSRVTFVVEAYTIPRGKPLDVGREQVFGSDRDPHAEERTGQRDVRGLATCTVRSRDVEDKVIDDLLGGCGGGSSKLLAHIVSYIDSIYALCS